MERQRRGTRSTSPVRSLTRQPRRSPLFSLNCRPSHTIGRRFKMLCPTKTYWNLSSGAAKSEWRQRRWTWQQGQRKKGNGQPKILQLRQEAARRLLEAAKWIHTLGHTDSLQSGWNRSRRCEPTRPNRLCNRSLSRERLAA